MSANSRKSPLCRCLSASDDAILRRWFARYRRPLLAFFRRTAPSIQDHEDLVQEVFVRLARRSSLSNIELVSAYVFQTASNVLRDYRRYQKRQGEPAGGRNEEMMIDPRADADRIITERDLIEGVISTLSGLPVRTRIIFKKYYFDNYTHLEIAQKMGIAVRTVEDHIRRANRRLAGSRSLLMVEFDRPPDFGSYSIRRGPTSLVH